MNDETAMHKRYWVIGRQRKDDTGGGYEHHVDPLDLDAPGATLTFDRERLEHLYSSADDTEVPEPDWSTFDKISAELGTPHVIRLGLRSQATEKLPGADGIDVTNEHIYLGFATLEHYGAAANVLMRPAEIVGLGDVTPKLDSSRKSVLPGHNLDESELLIGVPNHGCSACCSRHNHCDVCHETPFPSSNVHLNFHYDLSCSHRSFFHPEPDEFAADCTCECGCQCGNCRRSRELIYAIVDPPLGAWSLTFEVINESLSFHSGEPIFLVEFESVEKTPEDQWSIAIEGSVDELNGPLIPVEFEMPDEVRVRLETDMRAAIRDACRRLTAEMTAEIAEATAQPDADARPREAE
jgi:hypothetical protein